MALATKTIFYLGWFIAHLLQSAWLMRLVNSIYPVGSSPANKLDYRDVVSFDYADIQSEKISDYLNSKTPVILRGAIDSGSQEVIVDHDYLIKNFGNELEVLRYGSDAPSEPTKLSDILKDEESDQVATIASQELMKNSTLIEQSGVEELLPFKKILNSFYLNKVLFAAKKGFSTDLHMEAGRLVNVQLSGEKDWFLISSRATNLVKPELTRSGIHFSQSIKKVSDLKRIDWQENLVYRCTIKAGDILLIPPFFWHIVESKENSVSTTYQWLTPFKSFLSNPFLNLFLLTARDIKLINFGRDKE